MVERHVRLADGVLAPERFDNTGVTVLHEDAPHAASLVNCIRHLAEATEMDRYGGRA
jgi:hypothetical protein